MFASPFRATGDHSAAARPARSSSSHSVAARGYSYVTWRLITPILTFQLAQSPRLSRSIAVFLRSECTRYEMFGRTLTIDNKECAGPADEAGRNPFDESYGDRSRFEDCTSRVQSSKIARGARCNLRGVRATFEDGVVSMAQLGTAARTLKTGATPAFSIGRTITYRPGRDGCPDSSDTGYQRGTGIADRAGRRGAGNFIRSSLPCGLGYCRAPWTA
jgi:hypothetical protein